MRFSHIIISMKNAFREAFIDSVPVLFGYIPLGIGFGLLLNDAGYGALWALFMSFFIYSGSAQFALVNLMNFASISEVLLLISAISFRHVFYGLSFIDKFKDAGWRKPYLIHALTDETFAIEVSCEDDGLDRSDYYFFLSLLDHFYWVAGTLIGALLPKLIAIDTKGIDFSMTALFVVLLIEQLRDKNNRLVAMIGGLVSLICLLLFGSKSFLIPSLLLISLFLVVFKGAGNF